MSKMENPSCKLHRLKGLKHGKLLINHPDRYAAVIRKQLWDDYKRQCRTYLTAVTFLFKIKMVIYLRNGGAMNENIVKRNELLAAKTIEGLKSRNMSGYYAANKDEALKLALELIREGSSVTMGGCMSAHEIGLVDALKAGNYNFIDRDEEVDKRAAMLKAYDADVYLASPNAMTEDGVLVNIDGNSNRVSAIAQGPRKVIFIAGMNKVCDDVDGALKRARNVAAPINAQRFGLNTPCSKTGSCFNCKSPDTICCQFLITRYSRHKDRIHVILVKDNLGF